MSSSRVVSVDFETFYSKKQKYSTKNMGAWHYCDDPRFDPYLISVYDGEMAWAGHPKDFNWSALDGATLLSHNAEFDQCVYDAGVRKGMFPQVNYAQWLCTLNMSAYLCNRRSLVDAAEYLLGQILSKTTRDDADGKTADDLKREGKWEQMLAYGRSDAITCWQLFKRYGDLWPEKERRLSELTIRQGARGVQIDTDLLRKYKVTAEMLLQATEDTLPWIKDGRAPTSTIAINDRCRAEGIACPPVQSHFDDGPERLMEWENAYKNRFPWIVSVSNWRSINKFLKSLETVESRLMPGGIFSFRLKYFGAHTGRWSGDAGFNMQNLRKVPLYRRKDGLLVCDADELAILDKCGGKLPDFVTDELDIRKLFIARPGKKLILSDLSQIEPRVLAWLAGDEAMLELMRSGVSPYQAHAEGTMGWTGGDMKARIKAGDKEVARLYQLAKARVLGLGFGCGWKKFINVAMTMAGLDITVDDPEWVPQLNDAGEQMYDKDGQPIMVSGFGYNSKRIVKDYRDSNPKVTALWKRLDTMFKDSQGSTFEVELPSGRCMKYPEVKVEWRTIRNEDTGRNERKRTFTAMIGTRRFPLYGGLLTENAVQALARDVFAEQVLELDDTPGIDVLWTSHDEAINETELSVTKKDVEAIMSKPPSWMPGLPVACEAVESNHYLK